MKTLFGVVALSSWAVPAFAGPNEAAIIAAMLLSEAPNYSWSTMHSDESGVYPIEGRTQIQGYTWAKIPMPRAMSRDVGSDPDPSLEIIFAAPGRGVVRTNEGWKSPQELPHARARDDEPFARAMGRSGGRMGTLGRPLPITTVSRRSQSNDESDSRSESTLRSGVSRPHEELAIVVSSHTRLNSDGKVATGELSELGAQLLLVPEGDTEVSPLSAAGTFKLWLHQGRVVRYELRLEGVILNGTRKTHVRRNSDTVVRDVGTTPLEVPIEVREKLGG